MDNFVIIENNGYPQYPCDDKAKRTPNDFKTPNGDRIVNGFPVVFEGSQSECEDWLSKNAINEMSWKGTSRFLAKDSDGNVKLNGDGNSIEYLLA